MLIETAQRTRFFRELCFYIEMSEREQEVKLSGDIPSFDSYIRVRLGTSAMGAIIALNE